MDNHIALVNELANSTGLRIRTNILGRDLTTYSIGGPIQALIEPDTQQQLSDLVLLLNKAVAPFEILGAGSNLLISDIGIKKFVIKLGSGFRKVERIGAKDGKEHFRVGGAASLMSLSRQFCNEGLSGLEFAGGIPGSVGGAVRMNAGAHGGEISDLISAVKFIDSSGNVAVMTSRDLSFNYRHCNIPRGSIIFDIELALVPSSPERTIKLRAEKLAERKRRQPLSAASAGSVFKNPSKTESAGALIEKSDLKGRAVGGAIISEMHANWIINPDKQALAADVRELIALARENVKEKFGVVLEQEIVEW